MKNLFICIFIILANINFSYAGSQTGNGRFMDYNYTFKQEGNVYMYFYDPYLPRNDTIVIAAMLKAIGSSYGIKNNIVDLNPKIVSRKGRNLFLFKGVNYNYLFLIMKNENGTVYAFSLWRE